MTKLSYRIGNETTPIYSQALIYSQKFHKPIVREFIPIEEEKEPVDLNLLFRRKEGIRNKNK